MSHPACRDMFFRLSDEFKIDGFVVLVPITAATHSLPFRRWLRDRQTR
jgi:hypothetical protein